MGGDWAAQPIVTSAIANMTLGWWDGSAWVQAEEGMTLPVLGGEDYQVSLLGADSGRTTGGPQVAGCDILFPSDFPGIELTDPELLSQPIEQSDRSRLSGVAISAPWNLAPHHVGPGEAHPDLEELGAELLLERGFETESARIVQTVDADLDGDGGIETIVAVEDTELANEASGVYSLVFAIGPSQGGTVLAESVIPSDGTGFPESFRVGTVADLNGDRVMEIVLHGVAWENEWVTVYELVDDGFVRRISAGCGV